jgi:flagellar motor protein MotB
MSSLFFILFMLPALAGQASSVADSSQKEIKRNPVDEYRHGIILIDQEYESVRNDLQWLKLKILRMESMNFPVPSALYHSADYKEQKLKALEAIRLGYEEELEEAIALYPPAGNSMMEKEVLRQIDNLSLSDAFELMSDAGGVTIKTSRPILFASGSAVVPEAFEPFLKKVSTLVKDQKVWIVVDGFADKNSIQTIKYPSNFELGAIRAANVVHILVGKGISPSVFKVASTGKYRFPDARPMSETKADERYVNLTIRFEAS